MKLTAKNVIMEVNNPFNFGKLKCSLAVNNNLVFFKSIYYCMDISLHFEILGELDFLSRRVINQWNYNLNSCLGLQPL